MKDKPVQTSEIMVTALWKTIADFMEWAVIAIVIAAAVAVVVVAWDAALSIYFKYGVVWLSVISAGALLVGVFGLRWISHVNALKEITKNGEHPISWLSIDKMEGTPPLGRYNLIMKNGKVFWNVTELDFIEKRNDVVEWMLKPKK